MKIESMGLGLKGRVVEVKTRSTQVWTTGNGKVKLSYTTNEKQITIELDEKDLKDILECVNAKKD